MLERIDPTPAERETDGADYPAAEIEAMQRAVGAIFARWDVSDVDAAIILGGMSPKTYRRWRVGEYGRVNRDLADRMSYVLGIHRALRIVFAEPALGYRWMNQPNAGFAGETPLAVALRGGMEDLRRLRRYLDAMRAGW